MDRNKMIIRLLDKRIAGINSELLKKPPQGWIRTIREALGMTSTQLARRMDISQPRVIHMEKNEKNLKITTREKAAAALGCRLVYALIPEEPLEKTLHKRALGKAEALIRKGNINMALENQHGEAEQQLEELTSELLSGSLKDLWEEQ